MESLKDLLKPKTFNKISYVAVICWILYGATLLGIFAAMEDSDSFRCEAKLEKMDVVRGKCSDQYNKYYNKSSTPVYGFVIANFSLIGIVCVIYSQVVKSRVEANHQPRADAENPLIQNDNDNRPKRRLFVAYFCQLVTRFAMAIIFIVLQTQVLYPNNFPSDFHCEIAADSQAANASSTSSIQNSTMYECHNNQATKITSWMNALIVGNAVLAFIILIEIICILALRVKKGKKFLEDCQFHAAFLLPQQPSLGEYINSLKKSIRENTEKPSDLKALFQVPHGEGKRNKDLKLDDIYTNLVLIPNRAEHDFTGNREEQLKVYPQSKKTTKPISREEITDDRNKKILVVGRPGIGRTLFLTKWIRDWASGKAFNNFDFLFFLKFRKFNAEEKPLSLRDLLLRSEYSETQLSDQVWKHICENPERVLILFDGLDEFLDRSSVAKPADCKDSEKPMPLSALFYNIVKGNLLPGASVLTTTRPTAVEEVTDLPFNETIEILGFASEQVEEYVEKFAKDAVEDVQDAGKKVWEHIKTNMNIFSLCCIPVNCFIICSCLLQILKFNSEKGLTGVGFQTKLTEIYQRCVQFFFLRHDEHRGEDLRREDINSERLPPEVEERIKPLAKLAFDGLTQKIFGQKEVPKDLVNCALFHRLPDSRHGVFTYEAQYCFIHLTMQEFLAAKHITETMKGEELRAFIADHIENGEWQLVLQFVAGLLGEQSIDIFTDLLPKTPEENDERELMFDYSLERRIVTCWPTDSEKDLALTLLKCIHESNESGSVVQSKLEEIGFNAVDFSYCRLAPADCTAVVHFIKHIQQISLINLFYNNIGSLGCVEIVKLFDNTNCQLRGLNLRGNDITDEGVKQLSSVLANSQLSSLNLSGNYITDEGVKQLSSVLANSQLSSLNLSGNDITDAGVKQLSSVLANSQLSSLDLSANNITDAGVKRLSSVLANSQLSSLDLSANNITDAGVKQLSNVLANSQLSSLDLRYNNITYEAREQIRQANPNCEVFF